MHFVIVKQSLVSANDSHFSGGKHVIHQMAVSLATRGHRVSLLSVSTRGEVSSLVVQVGRTSCSSNQVIKVTKGCLAPDLLHR